MCCNYETEGFVELTDTFVDNDDGTITDTGARLVWMKYDSDYDDISVSQYTGLGSIAAWK